MALQLLAGPIIEAGESLSQALDCSAGRIVGINSPADWTGANISFVISSDGEEYFDLYDASAREIVIPLVPATAMALGPVRDHLAAAGFLKIRSGSRRYPVAQAEQRDFQVVVDIG